ncbi:MAG: translation initiation factor IF-2 [Candidatus Cloacimonetes bacterium]|nr:translation initiation factor IF-2 [Candidatus Cloacimonadota bacterium]MBL7086044.1 translation initiation factor IF-2 [Candidatus Cloacimonadota bacterium]
MEQIRVYELARELKISPQALLAILKSLKIIVKSHMSYIDKEAASKIRKMFSEQMQAAKVRQKQRKSYKTQLREAKFERIKKSADSKIPKKVTKEEEQKKTIAKQVEPPIKKRPKTVTKKEELISKPSEIKGKKKGKVKYKDKKTRLREEREKKFFDQREIKGSIKATLGKDTKIKKYKKEKTVRTEEVQQIVISEFTSVAELAKVMGKIPTEIVAKFMELGKMVTINQRLDKDSLIMICDEFDFEVNFADQFGADILRVEQKETIAEKKESRPPVVVVMGHVDHGKTSILDYIRKSNVIAGEAGGITQHIGAYQVDFKDKKITFIDTPGHEAFTAMRARGADITDLAVIVIAADDGVMPQTIEAIDHAKAADIPFIVAINKIDLPDVDTEKVKAQLSENNVRLQGWGGDVEYVECSAKTGEGIEHLLEIILLLAEVEELSANYSCNSEGVVIETKLDKGKGPLATILIRNGILTTGNIAICGAHYGRIRLMLDEREYSVDTCPPSGAVQILGLNGLPQSGDTLNVVKDEKTAKEICSQRQHIIRQRQIASGTGITLDNLFDKIRESEINALNMVVKADTDGSLEAICDAIQKLGTEEVAVNIIRKAVGGIVEADVDLATAANSIILGFHIRPNAEARKSAELNKVEIRLYDIIYELIDDVKKSLEGLLAPIVRKKIIGIVEVKQIFKITGVGVIAGCFVKEGKVTNNANIRLFRDDIKTYEGKISTLKHFQNEAKEVIEGQECGIAIENFNDIKVGDIIEAYLVFEEKKKLE